MFNAKRIAFPDVTSFAELFVADANAKPLEIPGRESQTIGNYFTIHETANPYRSLRVRANEKLAEFIMVHTIHIEHDEFYFEAIVYDDGTALLIVKYNRILGDRWLARVDASTIPSEPEYVQ